MENHIPSIFTIIANEEEETQILVDAETGEIIQEGEKEISGFLHCMEYFGYPFQLVENSNIA